jgi:hypothetical protein
MLMLLARKSVIARHHKLPVAVFNRSCSLPDSLRVFPSPITPPH